MILKKILFVFAIVLSLQTVSSQELFNSELDTTQNQTIKSSKMKPNSKEIEANFLSSYYNQDGNNSPVTGGIGTEALTDFANVFIINVPLDSINSIGLYGGADAYTSASTDNIDSNVSSASVNDVRGYGTLSYNRKNLKRGETYGLRGGYSKEYDYKSFSAGVSLTKEWNEGNTELNFTGQAFFDKWLGKNGSDFLIYPEFWLGDAFGYQNLSTPNRNSYNAQLFISQVINPRLQIGVSAEFIYMKGLLSTPFHSVYFAGKEDYEMDIERLPSSRLKLPFGVRLNYFLVDFLVLRTYYRYYTDDFGINAHTLELETPLKLNSSFTISPFYRFHTQTASKYFAAKNVHLAPGEPNSNIYYTSDYDLSALNAHKYGVGIKYYPSYGLLRSRPIFDTHGVFMFKYIELRAAMYKRSTGLSANNVSINLAFSYK